MDESPQAFVDRRPSGFATSEDSHTEAEESSTPTRSWGRARLGWAAALLLVMAMCAAIARGLYVESGRPALFGDIGRAEPVDECTGRVATCDVTLQDDRGKVIDRTGTLHAGVPPDPSDTVRVRHADGNAVPDNLIMRTGAVAWVMAFALGTVLALGAFLAVIGLVRGRFFSDLGLRAVYPLIALILVGLGARIVGPTSAISAGLLAGEATTSKPGPGERADDTTDLDIYADLAAGGAPSLSTPDFEFRMTSNAPFSTEGCGRVPNCMVAAQADWAITDSRLVARSAILVFETFTQAFDGYEAWLADSSLLTGAASDRWSGDAEFAGRFLVLAEVGGAPGVHLYEARALAKGSLDLFEDTFYERNRR